MKNIIFSLLIVLIFTFSIISCNDNIENGINPFVGIWLYDNNDYSVYTKNTVTTYYPNQEIYWTGTYTYNASHLIINLDNKNTDPDVYSSWGSPVAFSYVFANEYLWLNNIRLIKLNSLPAKKITGIEILNESSIPIVSVYIISKEDDGDYLYPWYDNCVPTILDENIYLQMGESKLYNFDDLEIGYRLFKMHLKNGNIGGWTGIGYPYDSYFIVEKGRILLFTINESNTGIWTIRSEYK